MNRQVLRLAWLLPLLVPTLALAQRALPPAQGLSLDRLYRFPTVNGRSPAGATMNPQGDSIVFGWNQTGERMLDVWVMDFPSGKKRRIVEASRIPRPTRQDDERKELEIKEEELYDGGIGGFQWAPDGNEILFGYRGRTWLVNRDGKNLRPLIDTNEGVGSPDYSPDGRYIAFRRGANLFRIDRTTGLIKQLTFLSKPNHSIGDFRWSPDSSKILVSYNNSSGSGRHVMMDFSKDRAEVVNIGRGWQGESGVNVQFGVISAEGGIVSFVRGIPTFIWTSGMEWSPDGKHIAIAATSEDFKTHTIWNLDPETNEVTEIYKEKAPKNYIPGWRPMVWSRDSKYIIFGSDIEGAMFTWRGVYRVPALGGDREPVYTEYHDVAAIGRPKDSDRLFLVTLARSPLQSEITILEPNGERTRHVVIDPGMSTGKGFDDAALPMVSDDGTKIATMASSRTLNPEIYAVEPELRRLTESQTDEFRKIKWANHEEVTFKAPDGRTVHGVLITPPNLDKTKKHPAIISNIYANSAKLAWDGYWGNYAAMELGLVVLQVDFRASWGYGGEFNSGYYESMGVIDVEEGVAAVEFLDSLGYVNKRRVGIQGWSYGGFYVCMAMLTKPGVFHAGVAVASVTDWATYNEWYTRRRLGLAKDNKEVYEKTSPIYHAKGLQDHLLLVHGMLDDNVLFQDTARLMQRLIEAQKMFDVMAYPRDDHGIGQVEARPHVMVNNLAWLYEKLMEPMRPEELQTTN